MDGGGEMRSENSRRCLVRGAPHVNMTEKYLLDQQNEEKWCGTTCNIK